MAEPKNSAGDRDRAGDEVEPSPRGFWSGTLTFGLVSIPVELYTANRSVRPRLRMITADGVPLRRAYFDAEGEREVEGEEIVRGYEVEQGRFVVVSDEELESLEPEKSRDILLRRFVPRDSISPAYFERAYFMAPSGQSTRPYAVLARTMEETGRVGVATFVMRGREHLVAIVADHGVLRAEMLRFADELRRRSDVGLGDAPDPPDELVAAMAEAIERASWPSLPMEVLEDTRSQAIDALAEEKLERGEDVLEVPAEAVEPEAETLAEPPDLVALLKQRLQRAQPPAEIPDDLEQATKQELYEHAKELGITGRSHMSKAELIRSIREARAA